MRLSSGFEAIAKRVVIPAFEAAFFALAFARFNQVLQTTGALGGRLAALGTASFTLLAQLVLALSRNR